MSRKPGRPRALTVDVIAQAALDDGIGTFSMPSVARRLGVAHSGLYRYVADRDDLLVRAIDRAFESAVWPDADQPWEQLLRGIGDTFWMVCDRFPGLDRAAQTAPKPPPTTIERWEGWIDSLKSQHFSAEDAAVAVEFVSTLALDCSATMARYRSMDEAHESRADIPVLDAYNTDLVWVGRGIYPIKLDIIIDGLARRRAAD